MILKGLGTHTPPAQQDALWGLPVEKDPRVLEGNPGSPVESIRDLSKKTGAHQHSEWGWR